MNQKRKLAKGIFWTGLEMFINKGLSFVVKMFLARILFPEDYGLVGMAAVFTSFVSVFSELGFGSALVQKNSNQFNERDFDTVFWTSLIWSLLLYLIVYLYIGPLVSSFYGTPQLTNIVRGISISVLVVPFSVVQRTRFTINMDFKTLAIANNIGKVFAGVLAIIAALMNFGVWSLVVNAIAAPILATPILWLKSKYVPSFRWSKEAFNSIFSFGLITTGTSLVNKITSQADFLIVGKLLGATTLGFYSFAFIITDTFRSQISTIINRVYYPFYSQIKQDKLLLLDNYYKVVRMTLGLTYPIMILIFLNASWMVPFMFGEKWLESIPIIEILIVSVLIHQLITSNTTLFRAGGYPQIEFKIQLFKSVFVFIPLLFFGGVLYGLMGVVYAFLIAKVIAVLISMWFSKKYFGFNFKRMLSENRYQLVLGGVFLTAFFLISYKNLDNTFLALIMSLVYLLCLWLFEGGFYFKIKRLVLP